MGTAKLYNLLSLLHDFDGKKGIEKFRKLSVSKKVEDTEVGSGMLLLLKAKLENTTIFTEIKEFVSFSFHFSPGRLTQE